MDLKGLDNAELRALAQKCEGFEYDKRIGEAKLRDSLTAWLEKNPEKLGEVDLTQETPSPQATLPMPVTIQSAFRGEIMTSLGMVDFGEDGKAEVGPEIADLLCELNGYTRC